MAITDRNLAPGTRLVAKYKGETVYATVLESGVELAPLPGGRALGPLFKSVSAAGSAVMGGIACNGWRFWSIEGEAPAQEVTRPASARNTAKTKQRRLIHRVPNQNAVPEGSTRWFCDACMKSFVTDEADPQACPEGHRADDPELNAPA